MSLEKLEGLPVDDSVRTLICDEFQILRPAGSKRVAFVRARNVLSPGLGQNRIAGALPCRAVSLGKLGLTPLLAAPGPSPFVAPSFALRGNTIERV